MLTNRPKGTKDWIGFDTKKRRFIEEKARQICKKYNINEIITPVFEHTELFVRSTGEASDIVKKEMYTFLDKKGRSISLKPEGTAGVIRAYIENGIFQEPAPHKLFYITSAYRYENPANGRFREHTQFGLEFIGSDSSYAEAEVISLAYNFLSSLNIKNIKLSVNCIGSFQERKAFNDALINFVKPQIDCFCNDCKERININPVRIIDCKNEKCKEILKQAPSTIDFLTPEQKSRFETTIAILKNIDIDVKIDNTIVRGLDYYTGIVFEFIEENGLTICGGGRYDNLVKDLDGKVDSPAVGFGMGIERLVNIIPEETFTELYTRPDLYIISFDENMSDVYKIINNLRKNDIIVDFDTCNRSFKAKMKHANKINAKYLMVLGNDELASNEADIKNLDTGESYKIKINEITKFFNDII